MNTNHQKNHLITSWLLRIGLAVVFIYAAVASLQHPLEWIGFLPTFIRNVLPGTSVIKVFAVYEAALAGWLLSGKYARFAGLLSAATLTGIVIANPTQLITTFRDIGLVFMALALFFAENS